MYFNRHIRNCFVGSFASLILLAGIHLQIKMPLSNLGLSETKALRFTPAADDWVQHTIGQMSLEEKIGQLLQIRCYGDYGSVADYGYQDLRDEIQKYHIGSVVLYSRVSSEGLKRVSPQDAALILNSLQSESQIPLLVAADLERGVATRLTDVPSFPWPMAVGATGDINLAERFGEITAREARAVGIHWALAPVADVNTNPANPTINDRSFGEDPEQVSALVSAFIKGAHSSGLLVTAKHFPGSGDQSIDPHRNIASIDADLDHLRMFEFLPFKAAIAAGVDSIMLAHARVPALDSDAGKITTISSNVIEGSLRQELSFHGVVITDALEMPGLTQVYDHQTGNLSARAAVDAIKAGCDVIMLPGDLDGVFHAIIDAVRGGEIPELQIENSVRKILEMKAAIGLHRNRFVNLNQVVSVTSELQDVEFAQHVADEAVTLVRDNGKLLPLHKVISSSSNAETENAEHQQNGSLAVILLAEGLESTNGREIEREISSGRPDATFFRFDGRFLTSAIPELLKTVDAASQVVLATYIVHEATREFIVNGKRISYFGIKGRGGKLFQEIVTKYPEKTVVIAFGSPYLIASFPRLQTYMCTYAMASTSEISAAKALFGEIQNHAKLPVTLPGVAPRGFSLPWPNGQRGITPDIPQGLKPLRQ